MKNAADKILGKFQQKTEWSVDNLKTESGLSRQIIHRVIKILLKQGEILKIGLPPKTFYQKKEKASLTLLKNKLIESVLSLLQDNSPLSFKPDDYLKSKAINCITNSSNTENYLKGAECSSEERIIVGLLSGGEPKSVDEILLNSGLSNSRLAVALLNLELQNIIVSLPGKRYKTQEA